MLTSRQIFAYVAVYRAGFTITQEGRSKQFTLCGDWDRERRSRDAAEQLLTNFEPLLRDYFRLIRRGVISANTKKLASYFPRLDALSLSMEYLDNDDLWGELQRCFLEFCLKYDGITQNLHWEVANWISRATRDISTRLPPLSKFTTYHDPNDPVFADINGQQEDWEALEDRMEIEGFQKRLQELVPEQGWTTLFTPEECVFMCQLALGHLSQTFPPHRQKELLATLQTKIAHLPDERPEVIVPQDLSAWFD